MPDQADVEQGLAAFIAGVLYPEGAGSVSAVGTTCRVYRGWPLTAPLEADLVAGVAHLTVQPVKDTTKLTTRFSTEWQGAAPACALLTEVAGERVRFSGSADVGVIAGVRVDGRGYAWRVQAHSTPGVVAAVLGELVRVDRPAVLTGSVLEFPDAFDVVARAVSDGKGGQELRRQEGEFRVTAWCSTPESRDQLAAFVDLSLSGVTFLDVGGWGCRIQAAGGQSSDDGAAVRAWRRDLLYRIEYPTVLNSNLPSMLFGSGTVNTAPYLV